MLFVCSFFSWILTLLLFFYLKDFRKWQWAKNMEDKALELKKQMHEKPQSGMWVRCAAHGDLPLTQEEYNKQTFVCKYHCPICKVIPLRIWRKT